MKSLAELILSLLALFEAEGIVFRANVLRTVRSCGMIALGVAFIAVAIAFFLAAVYKLLSDILPPAAVLALMGLICAIIAFCLIWSASLCGKITPKNLPLKKP